MFTQFQNLLRGCLLSVGVSSRKATVAVPEPIAAPVATDTVDEVHASDADDRLSAWEQDRAVTLQEADESEQRGLCLVKRALLLRLVVQFEDEGLFVVADELRRQADGVASHQASLAEMQLTEPTF